MNNNVGNYPYPVNFINESVAGTHPLSSFNWIINDSLISSSENFSHTFSYPGLFDVSLIAFDQVGFSDTSVFNHWYRLIQCMEILTGMLKSQIMMLV